MYTKPKERFKKIMLSILSLIMMAKAIITPLRCTTIYTACLQNFPSDYRFLSKGVLKQIENAVPPPFTKILAMVMITASKDSDRLTRVRAAEQERKGREGGGRGDEGENLTNYTNLTLVHKR